MTDRDTHDQLARFLAREGGAAKLLAEHMDDGSGRCSVCCSAGDQTGRVLFPCSLALAARRAQRAARHTR
jgi:hypothetical protein